MSLGAWAISHLQQAGPVSVETRLYTVAQQTGQRPTICVWPFVTKIDRRIHYSIHKSPEKVFFVVVRRNVWTKRDNVVVASYVDRQ